MVQYSWCKLCGASYVVQAMWRKVRGASNERQVLRCTLCDVRYVVLDVSYEVQALWRKLCYAIHALQAV
eukprot:8345478-Pyramimonas_sp.AAC.1